MGRKKKLHEATITIPSHRASKNYVPPVIPRLFLRGSNAATENLRMVTAGLVESEAKLASGRKVQKTPDAIVWILENLEVTDSEFRLSGARKSSAPVQPEPDTEVDPDEPLMDEEIYLEDDV